MIISSVLIISALILLESRDVLNGFLSQPFVTSLFIILFLNYDPFSVIILAVTTHLIFIDETPSGASLYPEYPFAFFIVVSSFSSAPLSFLELLLSVILIIIISKITAIVLNKKRHFFEKYRDKLLFYKKFPSFIPALFFSLVFLTLYSLIVNCILVAVIFLFESTGIQGISIAQFKPEYFTIVSLIYAVKFACCNVRVKNDWF